MRNLTPGPKFSILLAVLLLITLAVWPIGYAKAEKTASDESQREKRNAEEGKVPVKSHRSTNYAGQTQKKSPFYKNWESGTDLEDDDDFYWSQSDPSGLENYEGDGYGYDDDEYDHFNYNRYENGKNKLNRDVKVNNQDDKNTMEREKSGKGIAPEVTTVELLNFQAKNVNPMEENQEDFKSNQFAMKKTPCSEKSDEKKTPVIEQAKKTTSEVQKSDDENSSDKNEGNVKCSADKASTETKPETEENKAEKGKISEPNSRTDVPDLKDKVHISEGKDNAASDGKLTADLKTDHVKIQSEGVNIEANKNADDKLSGGKIDSAEGQTNAGGERNLLRLNPNSIGNEYKDTFTNENDPVIADDEKCFEDEGLTLAGLRDSRNDLPYQNPRSLRFLKETGRRMTGARSIWGSKNTEKIKNLKEPFHLDFPLTDTENTDYHRNYIKAMKRFQKKDDSTRILGQGDTPYPYTDSTKTRLATKVIEEEQRKRRSRLRRLKPNQMFFKSRGKEEEDEQDRYKYDAFARTNDGMQRSIAFADDEDHAGKVYRRRGNDRFESEGRGILKNKRENDPGFSSDKRKNQGKGGWIGGEGNQKKKLKDSTLSEEPNRYSPLVLLRRNDNGQQAVKMFVDGRSKIEESMDSDDLARLLSRDSNYVVLKKVPVKEALTDNGRSGTGDYKKEKHKVAQPAEVSGNHVEDSESGKTAGKLKDRPVKGKESRIESLGDFFKNDALDNNKELDEKMVMNIDNRLNLYQRGEPSKKSMYRPSLSQTYRHMKDFDESDTSRDRTLSSLKPKEGKGQKITFGGIDGERLVKSYKKEGKEFLVVNKASQGRKEDSVASMGNAAASRSENTQNAVPNGVSSTSSAGTYQMPGYSFQEIRLPNVDNTADKNRKYYLYGSENSFNLPKHEIKVIQNDFTLSPGSPYNGQNYNTVNSQAYNKIKNMQSGRGQSYSDKDKQCMLRQKSYISGKNQQCMTNGYHLTGTNPMEGTLNLLKKDESSDSLGRFIRDFQDFSQASFPNTYKSTDLPGETLQELTAQGDRHLRKLNNLLKEIISKNTEEIRMKNIKRGMLQNLKDQRSDWQSGRKEGELIRSGKWTSVDYDSSNQVDHSDEKVSNSGEQLLKDRKLQGKDSAATLSKDVLSSKRVKRQSGYDLKDSTKILEQKVKSTPHNVQPQLLMPNNPDNANKNQQQQQKHPSRVCLQLPPEKVMDLLTFYSSEREDFAERPIAEDRLCKRQAPMEEKPNVRKLKSLSESEKKKSECIRKSFQTYLDPLVRKMQEHEKDRKRQKREIELDESMPNDFHNFLVTSLGEFGSRKREVVKKEEAARGSDETREESVLGKRDTSGKGKAEKKSVSEEDSTNIRIKIVDGNVDPKSSQEDEITENLKGADSNKDVRVHEVRLIANGESKKRKKKKYASIRTDQSPQKQSISNHLPQVETVYNPSPGNNKAQMEKIISGDSQKGKCAQRPTVYNMSSTDEDNIIRNNLRTGNVNTFTFQEREEATPRPLQSQTSPPSEEFEMLNSKTLPKTKSCSSHFFDTSPSFDCDSPDIIYKDENGGQCTKNGRRGETPVYNTNPSVRVMKNGIEGYGKDHIEESAYVEYEDGDSDGNEQQGYRQEDIEEYPRMQEHLDPQMVATWKEYARIHLSPERHKEAMEREFQEAYFRSSGQASFMGGLPNQQPNFGLIPNEFDRLKASDKLMKRVASGTKISEGIPIGRRFFYSFKSELPDEAYYALSKDPPMKWNQQRGDGLQVLGNRSNLQWPRTKRSADGVKSVIKRRFSSGYLAENNYRKYHKKNLNVKREEKGKKRRVKRDSLADCLRADMMRRIEAEKRIRSKVKGLSSDSARNEIPFMESMSEGDASLPGLLLQQSEEEEKVKVAEPNPSVNSQQQQQQQQQQRKLQHDQYLKSRSPDVFKTFEIKRGRRENAAERPFSLNIATDADGLENYHDDVFLKRTATRKVKKFSDEGFEPIIPHSRFFEKSSFRSQSDKASEPLTVSLVEKDSSSSSFTRRAGDKNGKLKNSGVEAGQQKFQKMSHGFSHEAPLLTPNGPFKSSEIFNGLTDLSPEDPNLGQQASEIPADLQSTVRKESKEPLVNAVLVLSKREEPSQRPSNGELPFGEERDKTLKSEKRRAIFFKNGEDASHFRPSGQSAEIVNEVGNSQSRCESPAKPSKIKLCHNTEQSGSPFSQFYNCRNGCKHGIGNPGQEILESILGRVESNPYFRKVIGPGLKWRDGKCKAESPAQSETQWQPSRQSTFAKQVRMILARFVHDIDCLASQDFTRGSCNKLDSKSSKFLRELLSVQLNPTGNCKSQKFLGSILSESAENPGLNIPGETPLKDEERDNRRAVVARLLQEYRSLPDDEKKSVEILGQYLNHEMESLNRSLTQDESSAAESDKDMVNPAITQGPGETDAVTVEITSKAVRDADDKRASVTVPYSWLNKEKSKDSFDSIKLETIQFSTTESQTTAYSSETDEKPMSGHGLEEESNQLERTLGKLVKLGYGDAAGLQQSLKSQIPWMSNLNIGKGKSLDGWRVPKEQPDPAAIDVSSRGKAP